MFGKIRQQIDGKANKNLSYLGERFVPRFGEKTECSDGEISFSKFAKPLCDVRLSYRKKKYLLGGLYTLVLSGEVKMKKGFPETGALAVGYRGVLLKGKAFFKGETPAAYLLNRDYALIKKLTELDLYEGKIAFSDGKATITLVPLSGSYTYTIFPPTRHEGIIGKENVDRLSDALVLIASRLDRLSVSKEIRDRVTI
jgi:hypothetical protein